LRTQGCLFLVSCVVARRQGWPHSWLVAAAGGTASCVTLRILHAARDCHARRGFKKKVWTAVQPVAPQKKRRKVERVFVN